MRFGTQWYGVVLGATNKEEEDILRHLESIITHDLENDHIYEIGNVELESEFNGLPEQISGYKECSLFLFMGR